MLVAIAPVLAQVPPPAVFPNDTTLQQDTTFALPQPVVQSPDSVSQPKVILSDSAKRIEEWLRQVNDTNGAVSDTLYKEEPPEVFLDSSARVSQWIHNRQDEPMVNVFPRPNYILYLDTKSPAYKREFELDSAGQFITVREMVNGLDVKVPVTMPLEEYIRKRYEYEQLNGWRSLAGQYTLKQNKDDLSGLLSSLTSISIPVPANPLTNIFGGNEINLRISGSVDIRGAFRNTTSDQMTIAKFDKSRNEPDFNQTVQIGVNGTIGKKLSILADWNTQRTFEYENQLKLKYTGFEDEIIQTIEAGNVSLQTPSLVGGGQALFGIKAKLQAGPLTLTTLLSQKKGQTKELTVSGGSTATENNIPLHEYSKRHFFLDPVYINFFEELHRDVRPTITSEIERNKVIAIDVYVSTTNNQAIRDGTVLSAKAFIDLPSHFGTERYTQEEISNLQTAADRSEVGNFTRLVPEKDYTFDPYSGVLTMLSNFDDNQQAIAVQYAIDGVNKNNETFGGYIVGDDTTLYLKLVKPKLLFSNPSYRPAWDLLLKNYYPVRATNLKKEGFELTVWRRTEGNDVDDIGGKSLLAVLGLDRFNASNEPTPDNAFDFIPEITVDARLGEVIFPTLRPFDSTIVRYFRSLGQEISDSLLFSDIYDTTATAAQNNQIRNRYSLRVKATGEQKARYSLGFNIVEGSVQVLLNGRTLQPKVDYTVDYITGEVVILNSDAMLPSASVQVKFEQNDLFQIASKTLIGARGEIATLPNTNLGFTIMNLNQQTLSDKVRIGEEPTNNMMIGIDASTSGNLPFLTDAIDALPFLRTREMSTIRFGGEAAYMIPTPNTKKSTVASDHGASIAYIDDFEGARRTIPMPVYCGAWTLASPPVHSLLGEGLDAEEKTYSRARLAWYNRLPTDVVTEDIWPNRKTRPGQNQVTVLNFDFDPNHRGGYNYSPKLDSTLQRQNIGGNTGIYDNPDGRRKNWSGLMRYIGSIASGILDQNITYLEIWMQSSAENADELRRGKLFIDLGRINEDVIPNRKLNTEDFDGIPNGILNPSTEDVGLDMIGNQGEQNILNEFVSLNTGDPDVDPADPSSDDYQAYGDGINLWKFNGTEKNNLDQASGMMPNTEDLNNNGSPDLLDQYLEYELPLDTVYYDSLGILQHNSYRVGGGEKGWYQFRIPLMEAARLIGGSTPQSVLQNVQYMRFWVSGFASPVNLRFAEINLVGNQWQERLKDDSLMKVSVVNVEDNLDYYNEWYDMGIQREKDRTDPNQVIEANEQSLALLINDLPKDVTREIVKIFTVRPLDLINYKSMKMFVHGDPAFDYFGTLDYDAEMYVRFGSDTMNYYEFKQPIRRGWDLAHNEINIVFAELTSVKAARPDTMKQIYRIPISPDDSTRTYGVKGNPSLRQIREISIGVRNVDLGNRKPLLRGQIWVNELRLVDVDDSPGMAYRFDTQMKLADIGQVSFNFARTDPSFHGLDQRFGNQTTGVNWAMNTNLTLDKFFPQEWSQAGTSIPVSYSHTENLTKPKYLPNTDIVVTEAANRAATADASRNVVTQSQTLQVRDTYAVSNFRIAPPSNAWYIRDTFSKLALGFNYNTSRDRDPAFVSKTSWSWSMRMGYNVSIPSEYYIQPFKKIFSGIFLLEDYKDWKFYYVPITNLSGNLSGQRSRAMDIPRAKGSTIRDTRNFGAAKSFGFGWKFSEGGIANISGDYGLSIDRNLLYLDNDSVGRDFLTLMKTLFFGGRDSRYGQKFGFSMKPKIPNILDIPKYFDLTGSYSVNYSWQNTFTKGDIGKSAGFDNSLSLSLTFRLKSLTDPWFTSKNEATSQPQRAPDQKAKPEKGKPSDAPDTTKQKGAVEETPPGPGQTEKLLSQLKLVAKYLIKVPLLDFETISITYGQTNRMGTGGVLGSTGFKNFWGRMPFQGSLIEYGPSRLFQLGLINDPHGTLKFTPKSSFPFIGWKTIYGPRASNASLTDQYSHGNNITLRTNRPLWTGASVDINWKVNWQYSRSTTLKTDALGNPTYDAPIISGSIERSYLSIPPVLIFKVFKSNLENVGKKYDQLTSDSAKAKGVTSNTALAEAFEQGMEALPFLSKILGPYVPRPNWTLRWDGIEKIAGLTTVFERLSLEHSYSSNFRRDFRGTPQGDQQTQSERVNYGFNPLAGVNMTFKQLFKGNFSGNFKYNTATSYDLNFASSPANIMSTLAQEMSLSFSYSRRGFSLPLFGLNLSNDVDITMTYSRTKNSRRRYDPRELSTNQEGMPQEGSTRTLLEPRIRYVLSTRVTAALYYRYTKTEPDATGSTIFGQSTNEAGIDIHISI